MSFTQPNAQDISIFDSLRYKIGNIKQRILFLNTYLVSSIPQMTSRNLLVGYFILDMLDILWDIATTLTTLTDNEYNVGRDRGSVYSLHIYLHKTTYIAYQYLQPTWYYNPFSDIHESGGVLSNRNHDNTYRIWDTYLSVRFVHTIHTYTYHTYRTYIEPSQVLGYTTEFQHAFGIHHFWSWLHCSTV